MQAINNSPTGETQFSYFNGVDGTAGINFTISDGQFCGSAPRVAMGTIICGPNNAILAYAETSTCVYYFLIQSPLACPATQNFGFCAYVTPTSTPRVIGYTNWYATLSGVLVARQQLASSISSAINFYTAATYTATSLVNGQIQYSTLGLTPASSTNNNGAVQQTTPIWLLPPTSFGQNGGNDNVIFYSGGATQYLGTDNMGVSFGWQAGANQYAANLASTTNYYDNNTLGAGYYATVTYTLLGNGVTTAPTCTPPAYATQSVSGAPPSQTLSFCAISYASNIFDEVPHYHSAQRYHQPTSSATPFQH